MVFEKREQKGELHYVTPQEARKRVSGADLDPITLTVTTDTAGSIALDPPSSPPNSHAHVLIPVCIISPFPRGPFIAPNSKIPIYDVHLFERLAGKPPKKNAEPPL